MNELPAGWEWATLSDAARWGSGGTPKKGVASYYGGDIPWAVIGDLNDGVVTECASSITDLALSESSAKLVEPGAILIAMYGSIGKLGIAGVLMATNQAIAFAMPYDGLDAAYLFNFLLSQRSRLNSQGKGATQRNISQTILKGWPIPVPPLAEQRRIVAAIEEHFSRLDAALVSLRLASRREKALSQSILSAANNPAWPELPLGEMLDDIEAGKSFKTPGRPAEPDEWGVIKVSAMTWGEFDENENKAVLDVDRINPRYQIERGDLLLSRANTSELVGATVLVGDRRERLLLSDKSMRLITKPEVDRRWLRYCLGSPALRAQMSAVATGTSDSMRNISQAKVRALRVRVPTPSAQKEIAEQISEQLATANRLSDEVELAKRRSSALRRSILAAAFSGRLVPQDPSDEPASALLERIAAERVESTPRRTAKSR